MSAGAGPRFEVRVVDEVLTEDLARCTPAARAAIEPMVATLRDSGAPALSPPVNGEQSSPATRRPRNPPSS
ncbi:MAG: hypothetical protein ACM3N0_06540 [Chloroflexota bacterium]